MFIFHVSGNNYGKLLSEMIELEVNGADSIEMIQERIRLYQGLYEAEENEELKRRWAANVELYRCEMEVNGMK